MSIDFYFDVVCPYAWVASRRLDWLARVTGQTVCYRPILLGGVLRAVGNVDRPMDTMAPVKAEYTIADVARQAEQVGAIARYPDDHPRRTVEAMRLLTAADPSVVPALAEDLWRAYWTDNRVLTDRSELAAIARPHGVDVSAIDTPTVKEALRANTELAVEAGVFGVPTLVCGPHMVWGSDRLMSFALDLGAEVEVPLPSGPFEVFHDFASPYSYFGVLSLLNSGAEITLRPMLLGALFNTIGTPIVPLETFNPAKQAWAREDMAAQARFRGLPFRFTDFFPLRTVAALRVALIEPATTEAIYLAAWVHNRNIADPAVLAAVLDHAGFAGTALLEATSDPAIKAALRENTERAVRIGIPGAPAFLRADGEVFWGQDRLDLIAARESASA